MFCSMAVPQLPKGIIREFLVQHINKPQAAEQGNLLPCFFDCFFIRIAEVFPQGFRENPGTGFFGKAVEFQRIARIILRE